MRRSALSFAACIGVALCVRESVLAQGNPCLQKAGSDSAFGNDAQPYLTINKGASVAQPGNAVTVHAGT